MKSLNNESGVAKTANNFSIFVAPSTIFRFIFVLLYGGYKCVRCV